MRGFSRAQLTIRHRCEFLGLSPIPVGNSPFIAYYAMMSSSHFPNLYTAWPGVEVETHTGPNQCSRGDRMGTFGHFKSCALP